MSVVYNQALQHVYRNKRRGGLGHVLHTANGVLNTEVLLVKMTQGSQQILQKKIEIFLLMNM